MKKFVLTAMVMCAVVAAQAATFTFTGMDTKTYAGYTFYNFAVSNQPDTDPANFTSDSLQAFDDDFLSKDAFAASGASTWSGHYDVVATWYCSMSGNIVTDEYYGDESKKWWVMLLGVENDIAAGNKYVLFEAVSAFSDTATLDPTFDMSSVGVLQTGYLNSDAVPEPTSGMLMLFGLAGLALKRRR